MTLTSLVAAVTEMAAPSRLRPSHILMVLECLGLKVLGLVPYLDGLRMFRV